MTLAPGEQTEIQGSGSKPYVIKNHDGVIWSCTCPAWRNSGGKVDLKSCKHLRQVNPHETQRLAQNAQNAGTTQTSAPSAPVAPKATVVAPVAVPGADPSGSLTMVELEHVAVKVHGLLEIVQGATGAEGGVTGGFDYYPPNPEPDKPFTCTPARARELLQNANGRKLRPDEKQKLYGPPVLLAHQLEDVIESDDFDPTRYILSEKLDGVRCWWDHKRRRFVTREGNFYNAPTWFTACLPDHPLDGELWLGRQKFQETLSIVRKQNPVDAEWMRLKYVLFDAPHLDVGFEQRIEFLQGMPWVASAAHVHVLEQVPCTGLDHLKQFSDGLVALGAEGIMLRLRGSKYVAGRNSTLLKSKPWKDDEGEIIGHTPGKGRHKGRLGGLKLRLRTGVEFDLGSGLKDRERNDPPPIGTWVTFRYTELTKDGKPKCANYVCPRDYE